MVSVSSMFFFSVFNLGWLEILSGLTVLSLLFESTWGFLFSRLTLVRLTLRSKNGQVFFLFLLIFRRHNFFFVINWYFLFFISSMTLLLHQSSIGLFISFLTCLSLFIFVKLTQKAFLSTFFVTDLNIRIV
jgi:hypothetical protein